MALRRDRLRRALSDIDAATISTIHGFCNHVLDGLGIVSDLDREAELVENLSDLIEEVVDDLLVATYHERGDRPRVNRRALLSLGQAVIQNPTTPLTPGSPDDPLAGLRVHLADRIRREVRRRARQRRQQSYDDLLTELDATLRDPERGQAAREALRDRYRIALIDEFQDTDPVQWSIVSQAFAQPGESPTGSAGRPRALVLIGDPKQAIYAFRGADVYAYLDAAGAHPRRSLDTNWRADAPLLRAYHALFDGTTFGDAEIAYRQVGAAPGNDEPRLLGAPEPAPLRLRVVPRHPSLGLYNDKPTATKVRELIARDVAADIVGLLAARPDRIVRDRDGNEIRRTTLAPRDVAVLVRNHAESALVHDALHAVDVPAVVGGAESVFATSAATDWQRLLEAVERPASTSRVRALALSSWVGMTGGDVAAATEDDWNDLHDDVHRWSVLLRDEGVAAMHRSVLLQRGVATRLLALRNGERQLADLDHIGELLHAAATADHLGSTSLVSWLDARVDEAAGEQRGERLRRLETDDQAVQILTIHGSKGLEFPVVYCPFLWSSNTGAESTPVFHDDDRRRLIDVGGDTHDGFAAHQARAEQESRGEELRLMYVALTRARHQVVAWYAPAGRPEWSGLGRVLLCRDADGRVEPDREAPLPDDDGALAACRAIADRADGTITVEEVPEFPSAGEWHPDRGTDHALDRARFDRGLDTSWRRTSYTALTTVEDTGPRVGTEPDEATKDDETITPPAVGGRAGDDPHGLRQVPLTLAEMPGGTRVGTFVHRVLEHIDFTAADLEDQLAATIDDGLHRHRLDLDPSVLAVGLHQAIATPLGASAGGLALRDVAPAHRRDEVAFELPLHRDASRRSATVADIARLLREHLPPDDPLAGYPDRLPATILGRDLRGYLGGSIDLVLRRTADDGTPRFHVADYKTNRLGVPDGPLTAWDYRPDALAEAMVHGHYPIQALLYAVALHRILRWRLPGYDPATHLGAVLYLFVRGMAGPDAPAPDGRPCGVFSWDLPPALIEATSDLLHTGVARS